MGSDRTDTIRRELWELILAYKSSLNQEEVFPVRRRENDRRRLRAIADNLVDARHHLLDSKAYLSLATMQEEANRKFLAAGTTPSTRLRMLARVVRALSTPILSFPGRRTLSLKAFEIDVREENVEESATHQTEGSLPEPPGVRSRPLGEAFLERMRHDLGRRAADATDLKTLSREISFEEAEVLSQLASAGEIELPLEEVLGPTPPPADAIVSFVLKSEEPTS